MDDDYIMDARVAWDHILKQGVIDNDLSQVRLSIEEGHTDPNIRIAFRFNQNRGVAENRMTALIFVSAFRDVAEIGSYLLEKGADPNSKDDLGETPLIKILWRIYKHGNHHSFYIFIKLLLEKGADPNFIDTVGQTPLMLASYIGLYEIVELLLENGADPFISSMFDGSEMTSYDIAKKRYHPEVAELIKTKMDLIELMKLQKAQRNLAVASGFRFTENLRYEPGLLDNVYGHLSRVPHNPDVQERTIQQEMGAPILDHDQLEFLAGIREGGRTTKKKKQKKKQNKQTTKKKKQNGGKKRNKTKSKKK